MTIGNLIKAAPPATVPVNSFGGPWEPIEAWIGSELPPDYKELVRRYGDGAFLEAFGIYNPACVNPFGRFPYAADRVREMFVRERSFPMSPQPGGLLAIGESDGGHYILWLTRGPASEWPIVVWGDYGTEGQETETFECDLTDFLAGLITGEIWPRSFGPDNWRQEMETFSSGAPFWPGTNSEVLEELGLIASGARGRSWRP